MPTAKLIPNPAGAGAYGATWDNPSFDNDTTTTFAYLINNTAQVLYTGDIVVMDATGQLANLSSIAGDPTTIGTVGNSTAFNQLASVTAATSASLVGVSALGGNFQPQTDTPPRTDASVSVNNNSATLTDTSAVVSDIGRQIVLQYLATTNAVPQVFTITGATAATSYTLSANFVSTGTATGNFAGTATIFDPPTNFGPGFVVPDAGGWSSTSTFGPGVVVPIVIGGLGRVNISALTTVVAGTKIAVSSASVVGEIVPAGFGVTTPAFPATTVVVTNTTGQDVMAYINENTATYTVVQVSGTTITGATSANTVQFLSVIIPAGATFNETYSAGTPTWKWYGLGTGGTGIAVSLQTYAQRDVALTTAGITGHDSVRALIGRF